MTADSAANSFDSAPRVWRGAGDGPVRVGSEAHKHLFCRMLLDTFDPYKPAVIDWPTLEPEERDRLVALPIWDIAVQTEAKAGMRVKAYAATVGDPLVREAIELNGFEESRHKLVLHNMVEAYGITIAPEPEYTLPRDLESAFMTTGYSECIDSFFAFGLFALAKRSGFFPPALVDTFEPVMQEECRHILFFTNWFAWHRHTQPFWRRPILHAKRLAIFLKLIWERIETAGEIGGGENFAATGHKSIGVDIEAGDLMALCLAENDRRFAGYDARLIRPVLVPWLVRRILPFLKRAPRVQQREG